MRITKYKTMMNDSRIPELVKESACNYECESLNDPSKIVEMMKIVFEIHKQTEEYLYEICFNTKMKPVGVFEISHGTLDASLVRPREIYQKALMCGAHNIVIVHNHPSGVCKPSNEDIEVTKRVRKAGELMGIQTVDSIIIGDNEYYSFKEKGI